MRALLESYRWRRRILWALPFVVVVVGFAVLVLSLPRGSGIPAGGTSSSEAVEGDQVVTTIERHVAVTPATRREVNAVLTAFVRHAVAREDPERAWALATPTLKAGQTRAEWKRGDLPVYPFPAKVNEATGWYVVESFENDLLLTLVMHSRPGTKRGAIAYQVELKRLGTGGNRRWLVDAFIPERVYTPPAAGTRTTREAGRQPPSSLPSARLSPYWFAVPGVILSLIVLVPAGIVLMSWRRGRRAEREYRRRLLE